MMSSESGWSRPHEYSWPRWSRPNDWYRNGYDNRWDVEPEYWMKQGRWPDSRGPGWLDSRGPGYERSRRYNGDWMREAPWMRESWLREAPWMRESWLREPWTREPYWARSEWPRWEMEGGPVVKVIELVAQSPHSWEDATRRAIAEASQTIRGIRSIYIQDMQAVVEDDHVIGFRVNAKISFALEDNRRRR